MEFIPTATGVTLRFTNGHQVHTKETSDEILNIIQTAFNMGHEAGREEGFDIGFAEGYDCGLSNPGGGR